MSSQLLFQGFTFVEIFSYLISMKCLNQLWNAYGVFAIKWTKGNTTVGNLPREISKLKKYLLDRWAIVTATNTSENYWKLPFFQGGLEILFIITATMVSNSSWTVTTSKIRPVCQTLYAEPKDEVIFGSYITETNLSLVQVNDEVRAKKNKRNTKDEV